MTKQKIQRTIEKIQLKSAKQGDCLLVSAQEGQYLRLQVSTEYKLWVVSERVKELLADLMGVVVSAQRLMFTWSEDGRVTGVEFEHLGSDEGGRSIFRAKLKASAGFTNTQGNLEMCEVETRMLSGDQIGVDGMSTLLSLIAEVNQLIEDEKRFAAKQQEIVLEA